MKNLEVYNCKCTFGDVWKTRSTTKQCRIVVDNMMFVLQTQPKNCNCWYHHTDLAAHYYIKGLPRFLEEHLEKNGQISKQKPVFNALTEAKKKLDFLKKLVQAVFTTRELHNND